MNPDVEIISYKAEHALEIRVRQIDERIKGNEEFQKWAELNALGPAWSGRRISDGKILGCAGIRILWRGVGEAWAIFADEIVDYKKEAYHYVLLYFANVVKDFKLWRVQAHIRADNSLAIRYIEQCGFHREGLLEKFGNDGSDQFIYALLLEVQNEL